MVFLDAESQRIFGLLLWFAPESRTVASVYGRSTRNDDLLDLRGSLALPFCQRGLENMDGLSPVRSRLSLVKVKARLQTVHL